METRWHKADKVAAAEGWIYGIPSRILKKGTDWMKAAVCNDLVETSSILFKRGTEHVEGVYGFRKFPKYIAAQ